MSKQIMTIGHRGAKGHEPENTIASFEKAIKLGCDYIELDVHLADEELFVIHDSSVDRTTNGSGKITELTREQIESLDAGNGQKIPTLSEVLAFINGRCGVNIELKGTRTARPVCALLNTLLNRSLLSSPILISSFDYRELDEVDKEFRRGLLFDKIHDNWVELARDYSTWSVNLPHKTVSLDIIQKAHLQGFRVLVYTVNDPNDMKKLLSLGVDGIFTDFPDRLLDAITSEGKND